MSFFHIHSHPSRSAGLILSWFLFAAGIVSYFYVAQARHRDNPDDRVMPTVTQMVRAFQDAALKPAEEEEVLATPALIRFRPLPRRKVIGDLSDWEAVVAGLNLPNPAAPAAGSGGASVASQPGGPSDAST